MAYTWDILAVIGTILIFAYSCHQKKYLIAYAWGIVYGLLWEISTESLFNYQQIFAFYIWKDIPLAIIVGWGISIAGFQIISDLIQKKYKIKYHSLKAIACDILVAGIFGIFMEFLGSNNLALWTYPLSELPILANMPITWPIGWIIIGLINLSFVRRLESALKLSKT